jgi:hypothetical protein
MGGVAGAGRAVRRGPRARVHERCCGLAAALVLLWIAGAASPARAFEYFDGRLQAHGFYEMQLRFLSNDFNVNTDGINMSQWYHVFNLELEGDILPDGWGPFDLLSAYVRAEARFDCVWTRACGIFPSVNWYGDRTTRVDGYRSDGRRSGYSGNVYIGNQSAFWLNTDPPPPGSVPGDPRFSGAPQGDLGQYTGKKYAPVIDQRTCTKDANGNCIPGTGIPIAGLTDVYRRLPATIDQLPGFSGLYATAGPDAAFGAGQGPDGVDDPAYFFFSGQSNCQFGVRRTKGGENGGSFQILGPWNPNCEVEPNSALRFKPNPFNGTDLDPVLFGPDRLPNTYDDWTNPPSVRANPNADISLFLPPTGRTALPARPASLYSNLGPAPPTGAEGIFYPSSPFRRALDKSGYLDNEQQNFSEADLQWNRGGSQTETKELKEAYLDMEFLDSRLWIRAGKQSIVWGKTELFRTTDQFNPQDFALASLPSLEESRIALFAVRGVYSFYEVGPAEDVRLELALNFDQWTPADLGRCGEPYTVLAACNQTFGLWLHGLTGFAIAGVDRPPDPWESPQGLEGGARLEFRMGRFSFQLSDFWGYDDFPYTDKISDFNGRNVDPMTGRPRVYGSTGSCTTGSEPDCLPTQSLINPDGTVDDQRGPIIPGQPRSPAFTSVVDPNNQAASIAMQSSNIQLFSMICATSIGFVGLDTSSCGQSIFNSLNNPLSGDPIDRSQANSAARGFTISSLVSNAIVGNSGAASVIAALAGGAQPPLVQLNADPCDSYQTSGCPTKGQAPLPDYGPNPFWAPQGVTLNQVLTDEQEALLGCGHFFGIDCEVDGMDLLNAEASVLMQSFVGSAGTYPNPTAYNLQDDVGPNSPAPGTWSPATGRFFNGPPGGTRYLGKAGLVQIVGANDPRIPNGTTTPDMNPNYNPLVDGCTGPDDGPNCAGATTLTLPAPFDQSLRFRSEMAALSFNFQLVTSALSSPPDLDGNGLPDSGVADPNEFEPLDPFSKKPRQCSWFQPQYCSSNVALFDVSGLQSRDVRAGGNGEFGRRDWTWHSGAEVVLRYQRRNVLGFSLDFAEDKTKSNWGVEATWINPVQYSNNLNYEGISSAQTFNLTVSVDRPTFINFLNQNRTFFFNSQWFFQYIDGYQNGFLASGPYNVLGTFTVQTGYFQDRLLPSVTFVYDMRSTSGAALPQITYRFTENFSASVGMNFFWGRFQLRDMPLKGIGTVGDQVAESAYQVGVENGLSLVRERDEAFLRLRYTF